jgi:HEAT repeat protein
MKRHAWKGRAVMLAKFKSAQTVAELDFDAALVALDAADPLIRRAAARALRSSAQAARPLLDRLMREGCEDVRSALFTSLIGLRSPEVAEALAEALDARDVALRNGVVEALAAMPKEALPALRARIGSDRSLLRLFVVQALVRIDQFEAQLMLAQVLAREPDINICLSAFDGLAGAPGADVFAAELAERFPDVAQVRFLAPARAGSQTGGRA